MTLFAWAFSIAVLAGALGALPFAVLLTMGMDLPLIAAAVLRYLAFGIVASLIVGLPIALLVFKLTRSDQNFGRAEVFLTANGAAIVIATILAIFAGWFGAFFLGLPVFLAANVYAIAGWLFILRDYRDDQFA